MLSILATTTPNDYKHISKKMKNKTVLIIEDNPAMQDIVEQTFSMAGVNALVAGDGEKGLHLFFDKRPDIIILDLHLPQMDGWAVCQQIRQLSNTPIIFLTAANEEEEMIRAYDCGAIDFVTKPFSPKLLLARTKAILRQVETPIKTTPENIYSDGYLIINLDKRELLANNQPVNLTKTEFKLFSLLFQFPGKLMTYEQIMQHVWGWDSGNVANVHLTISRLRQKLEPDPQNPSYFVLEYGLGYRFQPAN